VLLEELETLEAELIQEEEAKAKAAAEKARPGLTMFTDGLRMEDGAAGYAVVGRRGNPGRASKPTWDTTRRRMTWSAPPSPAHWKKHREETRAQSESPSFRTRKQLSGAWLRMNLAPGDSTPSRRGSTLLHYAGPGQVSSPKSDGAQRTPRSLANLKWEISEKKWVEVRQWAGGRTSKKKYKMPESQRPDGTVAGGIKRIASWFYQTKTWHCLTGQYLNWTKNRATPQCWWCRYPNQTREHLFKVCPEWKAQQKILWAEVRKETGEGKDRWKIRNLLADERCGRAVLDFLSTTDVGRRVPAEEDGVSEVSEAELREFLGELEAGPRSRKLGELHCSSPRPTSWRPRERFRGVYSAFLSSFPLSFTLALLSFVVSLVRITSSWDRPGRRAKGSLQ